MKKFKSKKRDNRRANDTGKTIEDMLADAPDINDLILNLPYKKLERKDGIGLLDKASSNDILDLVKDRPTFDVHIETEKRVATLKSLDLINTVLEQMSNTHVMGGAGFDDLRKSIPSLVETIQLLQGNPTSISARNGANAQANSDPSENSDSLSDEELDKQLNSLSRELKKVEVKVVKSKLLKANVK